MQLAEGMDHAHWKLELQLLGHKTVMRAASAFCFLPGSYQQHKSQILRRAMELDRQLALQEIMESQQEMRETLSCLGKCLLRSASVSVNASGLNNLHALAG